ncbi:L,D-transpeptidase family protein [Aliiroseovarius crassostreae]|uniref:L,D-transpeptidase family protein n=1 Tax=Aliiroseovarius crassostreae TaxID=154981 RepID=UPI003C7A41DE
MRIFIAILAMIGLLATASCGKKTRQLERYTGPEVTQIVVSKKYRKLFLLHHQEVLKTYDIDLGFAPNGPKQFYGDGKTPEGRYYVDKRNARSKFHLSLGISYPNSHDRAYAAALGRKAGGDIFIHGERRRKDPKGPDWTAGCISVKNADMEEIWTMVYTGTPIDILP